MRIKMLAVVVLCGCGNESRSVTLTTDGLNEGQSQEISLESASNVSEGTGDVLLRRGGHAALLEGTSSNVCKIPSKDGSCEDWYGALGVIANATGPCSEADIRQMGGYVRSRNGKFYQVRVTGCSVSESIEATVTLQISEWQ